jgi:chemotaxis methyl-accepting protein methylase
VVIVGGVARVLTDDESLRRVLALVHARTGIDFQSYKPPTILRRIAQRIAALGVADLAAYGERLARDPDELDALVDALLIKTTWMFRDRATFDALRSTGFPRLFAERAARGARAVRAWVAGCSTGEEPFSLAMCMLEAAAPSGMQVSVLASDVDPAALAALGRGVVSPTAIAEVPDDLAARWLARTEEGYEVAAEVRRVVTASQHDVLASENPAPRAAVLASFDVVSCRNLLIYLGTEAQRTVTARIIKACAPGGLLVLGKSEMPRGAAEELTPLAEGLSIYVVS